MPSENIIYADRAGNIGWFASGLAPLRKNWNGLLPVPGDGDYEWSGYLPLKDHPMEYNPSRHWIATANHNILPKGYTHPLGYEWAAPFRYQRTAEMLGGSAKLSIDDFIRMQQDVTNMLAKRFLQVIRRHAPKASGEMKAVYERMLKWDARMSVESAEAALFAMWISRVPDFLLDWGQFQGTPAQLEDALGAQLRALRQGWSPGTPTRPNATPLGNSGPRQTSAVHLRPVQRATNQVRILVFEAQHDRVLAPEARSRGPRIRDGVPAPVPEARRRW